MIKELETALPLERLARLENFGRSLSASAYLYQPNTVDEFEEIFALARSRGLSIALRGAGRSYGDAALNSGQVVLDLRLLNRIKNWDAQQGRITVEPGVTLEQLWKHVIADGWWPPVVSGTMYTTLGGCLAANIHGKNNWQAGPLGEHVLEFQALLPNEKRVTCSPSENTELFYAMIGGMGLLGVFISITLQLKKIASGNVEVHAWAEPSLAKMTASVDEHKESDYVVGWVDCIANGDALGRGQIHTARYLKPGEDADAERSLRVKAQKPAKGIMDLVPKRLLPLLMKPFANNAGTWAVNSAKYFGNRRLGNHQTYHQSLAAFNFLLDYVPVAGFGGAGFIQYQSFLPKDAATDAYIEMLRACKRYGLPSYAGVLKRHRADKFLLSHAVDGYSLALDFRVSSTNRARVVALAAEMDKIVLDADGRFYFAKDSTLNSQVTQKYLGQEAIEKLRKLKTQTDPDNLLQHDLFRRCFAN